MSAPKGVKTKKRGSVKLETWLQRLVTIFYCWRYFLHQCSLLRTSELLFQRWFKVITQVFDSELLWARSPIGSGPPHRSAAPGLATRPWTDASGGQILGHSQYENIQSLKDKYIVYGSNKKRWDRFRSSHDILPWQIQSRSRARLKCVMVNGSQSLLPPVSYWFLNGTLHHLWALLHHKSDFSKEGFTTDAAKTQQLLSVTSLWYKPANVSHSMFPQSLITDKKRFCVSKCKCVCACLCSHACTPAPTHTGMGVCITSLLRFGYMSFVFETVWKEEGFA